MHQCFDIYSSYLITYAHQSHLFHSLFKFIQKTKILIPSFVRFINTLKLLIRGHQRLGSFCSEVLGTWRSKTSNLRGSRYEIIFFLRSVHEDFQNILIRLSEDFARCVLHREDLPRSLLTFLY